MKGKVCVFGSFNLDVVAVMNRFPLPGESLTAHNSMMGPGGKRANQATAALRAGVRVHYIGKVGNDYFGTFARRHLEKTGFDAITLFTCKEKPTGNALIYVAGDDAENMISVYPGANTTVTAAEVARCQPTVAAADILLVQLENNLSAIQRMIDNARAGGTFVILNPAPWQKVSDALLAKVDLFTPNSTEAMQLSGVKVTDFASAQRGAAAAYSAVSCPAARHHRRRRCVAAGGTVCGGVCLAVRRAFRRGQFHALLRRSAGAHAGPSGV